MSPSFKSGLLCGGRRAQRGLGAGAALIWQWLRAVQLRPDAMAVALYPDRLQIARLGGGWRRRLTHQETVRLTRAPAGAPAWQPAAEALATLVGNGALARARVSLVLSSHFVHYTLVPSNELLKSEAEKLAYARQRFVRVHGEAAQDWALRLSRSSAHQSRLACAIPGTLLQALDEVMAPLGRHYVSLQPRLMASFNRWAPRLDTQARWLAVAEPGLLCLALLQDGQWQSVRTIKTKDDGIGQLPDLLRRESCLVDSAGGTERLSVLGIPVPEGRALESGPWQLEQLKAAGPGNGPSGMDAAVAAVVGA